jgi:hypothetical protein
MIIFHLLIPVILHLVDHTVNVKHIMDMQSARAVKVTLEALLHVDQNVLSVLTAHLTRHVPAKNAWIHAQERVELMQIVKLEIIVQSAVVFLITLVILS